MAVNSPYRYQYETVAASQNAQVLGGVGATGDYLHRLVISVNTAATSTVTLADTNDTFNVMTANTAIGTYSVEFNCLSDSGGWKVTTGAGVTVLAIGIFSA